MSLDSSDFTSNDIIDEIQIGDAAVDIVGYAVKVSNNAQSPKSSKFHKIVISNGSGREVQIIAWNDFTKLIRTIELGTIVLISSVKANAVKNAVFNSGNVSFELLIKENSTIETFGLYKSTSQTVVIEDVGIVEAYEMINKTIKLEAIIRTEPRLHKNRDYECVLASITDGTYKLEIKFQCDCSELNLLKGTMVQVIGVMEKLSSGPPVLKIDNIDRVKVSDQPRVSFIEVLKGYHSK